MSLGNANSSAQSRGKNKSVVVKRRKEVVAAKDYNTVSLSPPQADAPGACAYSGGTTTYYHNGSNATPTVNDIVYSSKRAMNPNRFTAGHYKMNIGKGNIALHIDSGGIVRASRNCP